MTKKLNFPADENVFKDLIPINLSDSIILPQKMKINKKKYIFKLKKDPEPDLEDFIVPFSAYVSTVPAPETVYEFQKMNPNVFDEIYDMFQRFNGPQ